MTVKELIERLSNLQQEAEITLHVIDQDGEGYETKIDGISSFTNSVILEAEIKL